MAPILSIETRRRLSEEDRRWHVKAVLRILATVFAFLGMIMFAVSISITDTYFPSPRGDWLDGLPLASIVLSLIYNPSVLWLDIFYQSSKPLHPGIHVAVDLIIWVLGIPGIVLSVGTGWFWYWKPVEFEIDDFIPCDVPYNFFSKQCNPEIYTAGKTEIAGNVFLAFVILIHFTLFVFACIAAHKHRMAAKRERTERRNIELQYHRHPDDHTAHQPPAYTPSREEPLSPVSPMESKFA